MFYFKNFLFLIFLIFIFIGCTFLEKWQAKQFEKRFGKPKLSSESIPEWEKLILKYEDVIEAKIKSSLHLSRIHRKLGNLYLEIEAFSKCIEHLKKSIELGENEDDNLYNLATCQGNYARMQGWPSELLENAEKTLFILLEQFPTYHKAKYQLAILYFYGFAKNNVKSIWQSYSKQNTQDLVEKAIILMQEFQSVYPKKINSYFLLSNMFLENSQKREAKLQLNFLIQVLQTSYPDTYTQKKEYKTALNKLGEF